MHTRVLVAIVGFAFILTGCGMARLVERTQDGGIIALEGDRDKAWIEAEKEIYSHCGDKSYTIVKEGESVVGSNTDYSEHSSEGVGKIIDVVVGGESTTTDLTEWRIYYICGEPTPEPAAEEAAPAAAAPAEAAPAEAAPEAASDESPADKFAKEEAEAIEKAGEGEGDGDGGE
jgi:pyruvate/2-oxoglutarate dehydrogenase complex dihydrolipoamide acyltransferase (E2) component